MSTEGSSNVDASSIDPGTSAGPELAPGHASHEPTALIRADEVHEDPSRQPPYTHTRASGSWAAVVIGLVVLLILIIFILENGQRASVAFFGVHAHLPEGVALLLAAVIGGCVVVLAGTARILQLRRRASRHPHADTRKGRKRVG